MKLGALSLLLAGLAAAYDTVLIQNPNNDDNAILQHAVQIPVCANLCIFMAARAVSCSTNDYACQCSSRRAQLRHLTGHCMTKSCAKPQINKAHALMDAICDSVAAGVPNPEFVEARALPERDADAEADVSAGLAKRDAQPEPDPQPAVVQPPTPVRRDTHSFSAIASFSSIASSIPAATATVTPTATTVTTSSGKIDGPPAAAAVAAAAAAALCLLGAF